MRVHLLAILLVFLLQPLMTSPASAQPANCSRTADYPLGAVFSLENTPHIWLTFGSEGLRWVGDTRALTASNVSVRWDSTCVMDATYLAGVKKGDPILSAGLVKIGDPIWLAKWEQTEDAPSLLHIQSIADVELFGINSTNYGRLVLERGDWEARYGFSTDGLARGDLASAAAQAPAPPQPNAITPSPAPQVAASPSTCATPSMTVTPSTVQAGQTQTLRVQGFSPGSVITISLSGPGGITVSDTVTASATCQYSGSEVIPAGLYSGSYTFSARGIGPDGQGIEVSARYTVTGGPSSAPALPAPTSVVAPLAPPVVSPLGPSVPSGPGVIESQIDGEFNGWSGETIFRLTNGQIWQQSSFAFHFHFAFRPRVWIYPVTGGYRMQVEGDTETVAVRRLR